MQSFYFWKSWPKVYQSIWYVTAGLFFLSLIYLWFNYYTGVDNVIHWDKLQEQKVIETTIHNFRLGPFEIQVPAESYVIFEYFSGSDITPNTLASYLFLVVLIICFVLLFTIISTIERIWYFVAMGLFIAFMVSLRFEVLGLFNLYNSIPVISILLLYGIPNFYFNRFKTDAPFISRLFGFFAITIVLGFIIALFSQVELPFYHLTLTGYTAGLVLSILFIITIAHEVLATFIFVISQGSTKSLQHFSIISAIYWANLLITCLHEMGVIQWNFIYINLYLLLTLSAVLGIWGFKEREPIYGNILGFHPFGAYFFLALGSICFITTAQLLGNANDPALKIIRDAIIFSHTGFSLIFLTYVFSNFILMLARSIPIGKVLYKPNRMPFFTYRFAGLIAMLAFVFLSDWKQYIYHGLSGFYNSTGDMYTLVGNKLYAESFYEQGRSQGFLNHRSNYALARHKASRLDFEKAHDLYEDATVRRPSEYAYVNDGNLYVWEGKPFEAIASFQKAHLRYPQSGALSNNLALAFAKVHNIDSTLLYLDKARERSLSKSAAETNFFAVVATEVLPINVDSTLKAFNTTAIGTHANALAMAALYGKPLTVSIDPLVTPKLDLYAATLLNNHVIKNVKSLDSTFLNKAFAIASDSLNQDFNESLKASLAFGYYHQGNVTKALQILGELVYLSQSHQGKFNYIMGLWALEQGNPELASSYFTFADTYEYKDAKFYNAISLTETGNIPRASDAWDVVISSNDEGKRIIAARLKNLLSASVQAMQNSNDAEKYQFCRYKLKLHDSLAFNKIVETFENQNYRAQALLDRSRKYFKAGLNEPAIRYYNRIGGLALTSKPLYEEIRHFELLMLASRGELRNLAKQINKGVTFEGQSLHKLYYAALLAASNGDTATAKANFNVLATYNPYFEEGVIAAADFYKTQEPKSIKPYTILSEAIQINGNAIKLLRAYAEEALRQGLDQYAVSALQRADEIESNQ